MRAPILLLLLATWAHAAPVQLSGFDTQTATTSEPDAFEWVERGSTGKIYVQQTRIHDDSTLGSSSSRRAATVECTSGVCKSYTLQRPITPRDPTVSLAVNVNVETPPATGERTILAALEGANSDPGCYVTVDANRQLALYYASSATTWGRTTATGGLLRLNACSTTYPHYSCTAGTATDDCPAGHTACATVYWAALELVQVATSATTVTCELYLDGRAIFTGTPKTIAAGGVSSVADVALGAPDIGTNSGGLTAHFDDFVIDDSGVRAGVGYVAALYPAASGPAKRWTRTGCGSGAPHHECVNDWNDATDTYAYAIGSDTSDVLNTGQPTRSMEFWSLAPTLTLRTGEAVTAIEAVLVGRTSVGNEDRDLSLAVLVCPDGACVSGECTTAGVPADTACVSDADCCVRQAGATVRITSNAAITAPTVLLRLLETAPTVPGEARWSRVVNELGIGWQTGATANITYAGAALVYVRVVRSTVDALEEQALLDHNAGTDDGLITVAGVGDSTAGGTLQVYCTASSTNAGQACSQDSYCSWDPDERDKPPGGCRIDGSLANEVCRVCSSRKDRRCSVLDDCALGTCSDGACSGDASVSCTTNADCDYGTCLSDATCVESCPGGECPSARTGWPGALVGMLTADVLLTCGVGSEDTGQMVSSRAGPILQGRGELGSVYIPGGSNCEAYTGTGKCTCTSDADCGGGVGSCSGGLCQSGSSRQATCQRWQHCASGRYCQLPAPDYIVVLEGYNDHFAGVLGEIADGSVSPAHNPMCASAFDARPPSYCPPLAASPSGYQVARTSCVQDATCSGTGGACRGLVRSATFQPCVRSLFGASCTQAAPPCGQDADCPTGLTCSGELAGVRAVQQGTCRCTTTAQCTTAFGSGWACVGTPGACLRTCTVATQATDCGASSSCDESTFAPTKVCVGVCNAPCDRVECDADGDCGGTSLVQRTAGYDAASGMNVPPLRPRFYRGRCNLQSGRCWACGQASCGIEAALAGPCSCAASADCDSTPGAGDGTCDARKVCTAGKATRVACTLDGDCAAGNRCLSSHAAFAAYRATAGLHLDVVRRWQARIAALGDSTPPVLIATGLPAVGGLTQSGSVYPTASCEQFDADREYNRQVIEDLLAHPEVIDPDHVVDFRATPFDRERFQRAMHSTDSVHFSDLGSSEVARAITTRLERLNVCVRDSDGAVQRYCRKGSGSWVESGGEPVTCATESDCAAAGAGRCVRRECSHGCPAAGDTCLVE